MSPKFDTNILKGVFSNTTCISNTLVCLLVMYRPDQMLNLSSSKCRDPPFTITSPDVARITLLIPSETVANYGKLQDI